MDCWSQSASLVSVEWTIDGKQRVQTSQLEPRSSLTRLRRGCNRPFKTLVPVAFSGTWRHYYLWREFTRDTGYTKTCGPGRPGPHSLPLGSGLCADASGRVPCFAYLGVLLVSEALPWSTITSFHEFW